MTDNKSVLILPLSDLSDADTARLEAFCEATGLGAVTTTNAHRGQHSWCCAECNKWRKLKPRERLRLINGGYSGDANVPAQPWEARPARAKAA